MGKKLVIELTYDSPLSRERLCDMLGEILYAPDVNMLEELTQGEGADHWNFYNADAKWSLVEEG